MSANADPALEAMLPGKVGQYDLLVWSAALTDYMRSSTGEDRSLYQAWMDRLNVASDDVTMAVAMDTTATRAITILALKPKGADTSKIDLAFQEALKQVHWSFGHRQVAGTTKLLTEATNPTTKRVGYIYASKGILFIILTDELPLLTEALILLP